MLPPCGPAASAGTGQPGDAPVLDHARIQAVHTALANGSYRVDPRAIAARLDALEQALTRAGI